MKKLLILPALLFSLSALALPQQPMNGGTGVANNNASTITLGGFISTAGSFTLSGVFSTTVVVSATTVVTLPSGTHILASNDGSNSSGTWGINITGTAAGGAPPTGSASGDLTGSYPGPTIANLAVTNAKIANSTIDVTTKIAGIVPFANGGTNNSATPTLDGVIYFDGVKYTSGAYLSYTGSNDFQLVGAFPSIHMNLANTQAGAVLGATFYTSRADTAGSASNTYEDNFTNEWESGLRPGDDSYHIYDWIAHLDRVVVDQSGNMQINGLTASQLTATNSSKQLISGNLSGDVSSSQFVTTLATVNASPGTFSNVAQTPIIVVNGKGLTTSVTGQNIQIPESQVTNLVSDLAARISTTLNSAQILLGNGSNVATAVTPSGDWTMTNAGVSTISNLAITNAKIANSTIDVTTKITGLVPVANGGIGIGSGTSGGIPYFSSTSTVASSGALTANTLVLGGGAGATPTSLGAGTTTTVLHGNASGAPSYGAIVNADITNSTIDLAAKVTGLCAITNGCNNVSSQTSSGILYNNGTQNTTSANFKFDGSQSVTLSGAGAVTAPTPTTQLNISSSTQASARIVLSGQEFYQASNTSPDGLAFLLGTNRSGTRQLWIAQSNQLTQNTTNPTVRIAIPNPGGTAQIDALATDGTTSLPIQFGASGAATTIAGSSLTLSGGDVTDSNGNLIINTVNKGLSIKKAAVSAGTANAAVITGVVLVAGTVTINDSYVDTSTVCSFSVTTAGGTPGTGYRVTVAAGTVTVTTVATDTSTGNVGCIKGI